MEILLILSAAMGLALGQGPCGNGPPRPECVYSGSVDPSGFGWQEVTETFFCGDTEAIETCVKPKYIPMEGQVIARCDDITAELANCVADGWGGRCAELQGISVYHVRYNCWPDTVTCTKPCCCTRKLASGDEVITIPCTPELISQSSNLCQEYLLNPAPSMSDLTMGATVSCSTEYAGFPCTQAIDSYAYSGSEWSAETSDTAPWIQLDFSSESDVYFIRIWSSCSNSEQFSQILFEFSDGFSFTGSRDCDGSSDYDDCDGQKGSDVYTFLPARRASWVKLSLGGDCESGGIITVLELDVTGSSA